MMGNPIEKKAQKPSKKKATQEPSVKKADFEDGFAEGFQKGFNAGRGSKMENCRRAVFDEGVRALVTLAEDFLAKELGLPSREALAQSGKLPTWWIATLITTLEETKTPKKKEETDYVPVRLKEEVKDARRLK